MLKVFLQVLENRYYYMKQRRHKYNQQGTCSYVAEVYIAECCLDGTAHFFIPIVLLLTAACTCQTSTFAANIS